jgi:hypothetical protein
MLRDQILNLLRKKRELTYPELLMETMAEPDEVREILLRLEEENKIQCEKETSENLQYLPPNLRFPNSLRDRIHYDSYRRLLIFRGKMSPEEREALRELSSDVDYRKAISLLFLKSQIEVYRPVESLLERFAY